MGIHINQKQNVNVFPELVGIDFTFKELSLHFSTLLIPTDYNTMFTSAITIAAQKDDQDKSLPAEVHARILSFLYQPASIRKEIDQLKNLLPEKAGLIDEFATNQKMLPDIQNQQLYKYTALGKKANTVVEQHVGKFRPNIIL